MHLEEQIIILHDLSKKARKSAGCWSGSFTFAASYICTCLTTLHGYDAPVLVLAAVSFALCIQVPPEAWIHWNAKSSRHRLHTTALANHCVAEPNSCKVCSSLCCIRALLVQNSAAVGVGAPRCSHSALRLSAQHWATDGGKKRVKVNSAEELLHKY